jgi:hypothetical protein
MRTLRELEPPSTEEGFAAVEVIPFTRAPRPEPSRAGLFVAAAALLRPGWEAAIQTADRGVPCLIFDWRPDATVDVLAPALAQLRDAVADLRGAVTPLRDAVAVAPVEAALCPHGGGPPRCWCRPPLPGLPLAFAHAHDVDPSRSMLIGASSAHRTLAGALGAHYLEL